MKWIKRPSVADYGSVYVNLEQITDVSFKDDPVGDIYNIYFYTNDEDNMITWKFKSSESLQTYIKENLERLMEVNV